ncbi:MAG TPA: glycosyltransferase family 4 protein, partial [Methanosarcina sp.]|nr:glycosyltransferase family 4 protein [Methanosarcina sp.]
MRYEEYMRVLHIYKTYYPETYGGVENVILQVAEGARKYGVECKVLTVSQSANPEIIKIHNHEVVRAKTNFRLSSAALSFDFFRKFTQLSEEADLLHYHFPWPLMDMAHLGLRIKKPSVVSYHLDITKQKFLLPFYRPLQNAFLSSVDRITVSSENYMRHSPVLMHFRDKVNVIPLGIDPSSYPKPDSQRIEKWRKQLPARFFLFVGVFRYYKGLHYLLEAAKQVDCPLVLVGAGPEEETLKTYARENNLQHVHFLGSLDDADKMALLELCSAFVFPSHLRSESFGISLLEASMHAKPMISCEMGSGTTFVNLHGQTGLAVPPADPNALAGAMRLLWDDPALAEHYGKNALERFMKLFLGETMVG